MLIAYASVTKIISYSTAILLLASGGITLRCISILFKGLYEEEPVSQLLLKCKNKIIALIAMVSFAAIVNFIKRYF